MSEEACNLEAARDAAEDAKIAAGHEEWRAISGYEGRYEISSLGRVRTAAGKVLRFSKLPKGYSLVSLSSGGRHTGKSFKVSRLVALAFHLNPDGKPQVNHINGVKDDDRACNLEWVTSSENQIHAWATGLRRYRRPSVHPSAKLTREKVEEIRSLVAGGMALDSVAARFSVSRPTVSNIKNNKYWV